MCSIILREIESPKPIPECFVVINGSNTRDSLASVIPGPVLDVKRDDVFCVLCRYQPKCPLGGGTTAIASIAFLTRFKTTC